MPVDRLGVNDGHIVGHAIARPANVDHAGILHVVGPVSHLGHFTKEKGREAHDLIVWLDHNTIGNDAFRVCHRLMKFVWRWAPISLLERLCEIGKAKGDGHDIILGYIIFDCLIFRNSIILAMADHLDEARVNHGLHLANDVAAFTGR